VNLLSIYTIVGPFDAYPAEAGATTPIDIYRVGDANISSRT
jgi:hypothetical protein